MGTDRNVVAEFLTDVEPNVDEAWQKVRARARRRHQRKWLTVVGFVVVGAAGVLSQVSDRDSLVDMSTSSPVDVAERARNDAELPETPGSVGTANPDGETSPVWVDGACDVDALSRLRDRVEQNIEEVLDSPIPSVSVSAITPESAAAFATEGRGGPDPCSILLIVGRELTADEAARLERISDGTAEAVYGEFWQSHPPG